MVLMVEDDIGGTFAVNARRIGFVKERKQSRAPGTLRSQHYDSDNTVDTDVVAFCGPLTLDTDLGSNACV